MTFFVTKADGEKQEFNKNKIVKTCMRMGATRKLAINIADSIEKNGYTDIETSKILQMIFRRLKKHKPSIQHQIDLKKALALMRSSPDFERFIQILLAEHGYEVIQNRIIRGKCVEHEIDAIIKKDVHTYVVEIKHHSNYHVPTGLDVSRIARAVFEDLTEGFELGLNNLEVDRAMIICNTKLSKHAQRYAECRGIHYIGWSSPSRHDLQTMIEEKQLYPITYLKGLNQTDRRLFASRGIILLKQLIAENPADLSEDTGIPRRIIDKIFWRTKTILSNEVVLDY